MSQGKRGVPVLRFKISGGEKGLTGGPLAYVHFEVGEDVGAGTFQVDCEGKLFSLQSAQEVEVQVYGGTVSILAPGVHDSLLLLYALMNRFQIAAR